MNGDAIVWSWRYYCAVVLFLLAACAPIQSTNASASTAEQPNGQVAALRLGIVGDERTLTPYTYVTGYAGWNLLLLQYDTLYQLDPAGVAQPWLATAATTSEDGLTVTLDLRDDVTWHDGEPLTAADVQFTFAYFKQYTQSYFTRALRPITSASADGEHRVVLTLTAPTPLVERSVFADIPILPAHIWATIADPAEHVFETVRNVGTGPYQLVEYVPDQFYRFTRNPAYFAGVPTVAELVVVQYANDVGSMAALRTGEIDMLVHSVPPEQIELLQAAGDLSVAQGAFFATEVLVYDMSKPPFDQAAVRQAIALAIDRQTLIDTVLLGMGTPGNIGWIHPGSSYFNAEVSTLYDPAQARALLDEAAITDSDGDGIREVDGVPLAFALLTPNDNARLLHMAALLGDMLRTELGMDVQITAVGRATWGEAVWPSFDVANRRTYAAAMWDWSAPVQANAARVITLVHSDPAIGSLNLTGYASAAMNALAAELSVAVEPTQFATVINEIQMLIAQDLPFITLAYPAGAFAYRNTAYAGWIFVAGQGLFLKLSFLPTLVLPTTGQ